MDAMSLTTSSHTMSPSQSLPVQPHFISLHNFEMSVVDCMTKLDDGQWSCKICDERFDDIIMLVFHLLSSHNNASTTTTFSNAAVIHICMLLEESESMGMFQSYVQVAAGDLDTDTESEGPDDEPRRSSKTTSQDYPAAPPVSLSAEAQREWTFRRNRARDIENVITSHPQPGSNKVDQAAALAAWNATPHLDSWKANAKNAPRYRSFGALRNRASLDRGRLRELMG
ncbi:MAG: hypothetical protein Q9161_003685 [Pseudevernia consocians]